MTKTIWIDAEVLIRSVRQSPMRETNGHPAYFVGGIGCSDGAGGQRGGFSMTIYTDHDIWNDVGCLMRVRSLWYPRPCAPVLAGTSTPRNTKGNFFA